MVHVYSSLSVCCPVRHFSLWMIHVYVLLCLCVVLPVNPSLSFVPPFFYEVRNGAPRDPSEASRGDVQVRPVSMPLPLSKSSGAGAQRPITASRAGLHAAVPQAPPPARTLLPPPRRVPTTEVAEQAGRGSMRLCCRHRRRPDGVRAREQGCWS